MRDWILRQPLWANKVAAVLLVIGCFAVAVGVTVVPVAIYMEPLVWWALAAVAPLMFGIIAWIVSYWPDPD